MIGFKNSKPFKLLYRSLNILDDRHFEMVQAISDINELAEEISCLMSRVQKIVSIDPSAWSLPRSPIHSQTNERVVRYP